MKPSILNLFAVTSALAGLGSAVDVKWDDESKSAGPPSAS